MPASEHPARATTPDALRGAAPQVIVAQLGARRHYLVPTTFYQRGMLARFYTDLYVNGLMGNLATAAARMLPVRSLRRLSGRHDEELPGSRVHSFPWLAMHSRMRLPFFRRRGELTAYWLWVARRFSRRVADCGFAGADAVYAYSSSALELFEAARRQKRFCILDQATAPKRFEDALTRQQADRYPGWAASPPQEDRWVDDYADRQNHEAELADLILCGSTFVRAAVEAESGQGDKCIVVPLGLRRFPNVVEAKVPDPARRLRILFVGDEAIRKGIGDLYTAVRSFGQGRCEARVAGNIDLSPRGRAAIGGALTLLGPVPRSEMADQYCWADVCVLPSVSDTFGLVILEALSHGVPVITTHNTGGADVITDGSNGFVVPIMSPETIADRLERIATDRSLLASMSSAAIEQSRTAGIDEYADRLVGAVRDKYREWRSAEGETSVLS